MADMVIVKAKIKEFAPGFNISGDVAEALDAKAKVLIKEACERAQANGRKTVMAKDL
jgi:histone H3/H4